MSIEDRIRERVLAELDLTENLSDAQILEEIRREICLEGKRCALSYDRRKELERHIFHSLRRLDILQDFLEDEDITEIMVNGPSCIFLERQGRIERSKRQFYSAEKLQDVIQQIASTQNQIISETNPILDTRIPEFGARVNIVMPPDRNRQSCDDDPKVPQGTDYHGTPLRIWLLICGDGGIPKRCGLCGL